MHILKKRHECGPINSTMDLPKPCEKSTRFHSWENYYIHEYHMKGQFVE